MPFTVQLINAFTVSETDQFGAGGRTTVSRQMWLRAVGCDRHIVTEKILAASLASSTIAIEPLGADSAVASTAIYLLNTNIPVDVNLNGAGFISGVRMLVGDGVVSSLSVNTGSTETQFRFEAAGGSGVSIIGSFPFP